MLPFHDKSRSGIKYGGCAIEDIFSENYSSQGEKETAHEIAYVKTYKDIKRSLSKYPKIILADEDEQINQKINLYYEDLAVYRILCDTCRISQNPKSAPHLFRDTITAWRRKEFWNA
ncbi:MAG: hypothetical protein Q4A70_02490 [Candidatus Saccharibacteria bacterium]|nr:hypothetical protein [Candidatus Saccharibacteria bacterium]